MRWLPLALLLALCGLLLPALGADVSRYALIKNRSFDQTNASTGSLSAVNPFLFTAVVEATTNTVTSATLQTPLGAFLPMTNTPGIGPFSISQAFSNQAAMEAAFTNGTYGFTINAVNDGTQTPSLTITGNAYPNTPTVTNFSEAQLIRAGSNFTVRWAPFTGGTVNDTILFTIRSNGVQVFTTPLLGSPGALNGTALSATIPASTLATGMTYSATLSFARLTGVDLSQYLGVPGITLYASSTDFRLRTLSVPVLNITNTPAGIAQLRFNSDSGRSYDIRSSADLANWLSLMVTNAAGSTVIYSDTNSPGFNARYYRLQEP